MRLAILGVCKIWSYFETVILGVCKFEKQHTPSIEFKPASAGFFIFFKKSDEYIEAKKKGGFAYGNHKSRHYQDHDTKGAMRGGYGDKGDHIQSRKQTGHGG